MGTSIGSVGIFDSETLDAIQMLTWHKDKVRMLLVMPPQVEACICAEVPFTELEDVDHDSAIKKSGGEFTSNGRQRRLSKKPTSTSNLKEKSTFVSQMSFEENMYSIQNPEPESNLITSVGNGRCTYSVHTQSKEDKVQIFNKAAQRSKSANKAGGRQQWDDIVLRTWKV